MFKADLNQISCYSGWILVDLRPCSWV